jgi:L-ornithine N5-oxygenase
VGPEEPGSFVVDLLGIGFGPANLALAIATVEHNESGAAPLTVSFLEQQPEFGWHRGMLLDGATMQITFLKDLVTLRNPVSRFGFLSYLHSKNRLIDFINHKCLYPSRVEFHDYLQWCATQVGGLVRYGQQVISARPVMESGVVTRYAVTAKDIRTGEFSVTLARNLVVGPGLRPRLPDKVLPSTRVWHSHFLLEKLKTIGTASPRRFVVLGAGQSAAEVTDYLHRRYETAEIFALLSRFGYSQADDSPYANRIFDPESVDVFYAAPEEVKLALMRYHANTNYAVVDIDLIEDLYRRDYQEQVQGERRLHLVNVAELAGARELADGVEVTIRHLDTDECTIMKADVLVCATGYDATDPRILLGDVAPLLWSDPLGRLQVGRDYRAAAGPEVLAGVYLCGGTEHSHGITSSLLSMAAVRAGDILRSVVEHSQVSVGAGALPAAEPDPRPRRDGPVAASTNSRQLRHIGGA